MARSSGYSNGDLPDTALHVLLALVQPRHGYAIMQFLDEESDGDIQIGPASLYTTLKKLLAANFISEREKQNSSRRVYSLTPAGKEALLRNVERRRRFINIANNILEKK